MSSGAKKGALGVAAMLGLVGVRSADNCASAGVRATRAVGDDALRMGARTGDDLVEAGARGGRIQWGPGPAAMADAIPSPAASGDGVVEALAEGGVEVALQVVQFEARGGSDAPAPPTELACPVAHDLTLEPTLWKDYLGGFGIACAPKVLIGRAQGDTFEAGHTFRPLPELFAACAEAGGVCFFVGCEGDGRCFTDAARAAHGVSLGLDLVPYMYALAQKELAETTASWVAFSPAPGEVTVLRRQSD